MNTTSLRAFLAAFLALPLAAAADFQAGLAAYERGDLAAAQREFTLLAEGGDANAQYNLGMLYLKRSPPDYARARPWLHSAAKQGVSDAQYMLGLLTYYGVGMASDEKAALQLLERAMAQGDADAGELVAEIRARQARLARQLEIEERNRRSLEAAKEQQRREAAKLEGLRKQLEQAKAAEHALEQQLAHAEKRVTTLESERDTLRKASTDRERAAKGLSRERQALEARLAALETKLAAAPPIEGAAYAAAGESFAEQVLAGTILDVVPGGIVLTDVSRRLAGEREMVAEKSAVFVHLTATNGIVTGRRIEFLAEPAEPYAYRRGDGDIGRIPAYRVLGERTTR